MEQTFDLKEILFLLKRQWKWLIWGFAAGAVLAFLFSTMIVSKKYTSSVDMYVNNTTTIPSGNMNINDLNASQKLVDTYIVILQNNEVMEQVAQQVGSITTAQLRSAITLSAVSQTEVLRITAKTTDPLLSAEICNTFSDIAPVVLQRVVKAGSAEVINTAKPATAPSSPSVSKNTLIGAFLGLLLAGGIIFLLFMLDNTVKGEADIRLRLDVPVLGEIPQFLEMGKEEHRHVR